MAPPDRQGSFTNTAIWSCTLLAIAALTVWKFEIWPIVDFVTETGTLESKDVAAESIAVEPITIARPGASDQTQSVIEPVDSTSDEAPPPAELAKLDIASSLPPLPQAEASDWSREPPPLPQDNSSNQDTSPKRPRPAAPKRLPTGADFGDTGAFPQAKRPQTERPSSGPPEQLAPVPTAEPELRPIDQSSKASASPKNPFVDTIAASNNAASAASVDTAHFESETAEPRLAEIDADIAAGSDLAAHRALSKLYWDQPERRPEIQDRIDQTANSIYFNPQPHYMPAHVSQAEETLAEIAESYHLPAEYLVRLNKLSDPASLQPGQELKVVKGPFAAVLDLDNQVMILHAHGYYVRGLPCEITLDASATGSFQVHAEEGNTILLANEQPKSDNPFADADPSPAGIIRLTKNHASIAQDLLIPGAKITIHK